MAAAHRNGWLLVALALGCAPHEITAGHAPDSTRAARDGADAALRPRWGWKAALRIQPIPRNHHTEDPRLVVDLSNGDPDRCTTVSPDAEARLDGVALSSTSTGGPRELSQQISGMTLTRPGCAPVRFETQVALPYRARSRLVITDGKRGAVVEVEHLLGPPPVIVTPTVVAPGDVVTLELDYPAGDEASYDVPTTVALRRDSSPTVWIEEDGFAWTDGAYAFVLPEVSAGPLTLEVIPAFHEPATVAKCAGVDRCDAEAYRSRRVATIEVVGR